MGERLEELEAEIGQLEAKINACESALQTFVSAEETTRKTHELDDGRAQLQRHLSEWEELTQVLQEEG
jgi:hypothetical protein